jgi:hypothetical protein
MMALYRFDGGVKCDLRKRPCFPNKKINRRPSNILFSINMQLPRT